MLFEQKRMAGYLPNMRFFCILFLFLFPASALADQTDPSLEALFTELRDGSVLDAQETTGRIVEIWSEAPSPAVTILYGRAEVAAMQGEIDLAEELSLHVTGLAPHFAQGWVLHASIMMAQEDREQAIVAYEKAVELEPRHFIAQTDLADILFSSGQLRAAFDLYQKALEWNPHYERAREQAARLRRELSGQEI